MSKPFDSSRPALSPVEGVRRLPLRVDPPAEKWAFRRFYGRFNWGLQILGQAYRRLVGGAYPPERWL